MKPWISLFLFISVQTVYIDDSIYHDITYHSISEAPDPEELLKHLDMLVPNDNYLSIRSAKDERYVCQLPEVTDENIAPTTIYTGPSPPELLAPLSTEQLCSFRQDTYWFYELCHGRYLVQFHEDKNTKKRTEFYLGNFKQDYVSVGMSKIEQMNPPKRMVEGEERAYYNVSYVQGTHCDLINGPRTANILYVCSEDHRHHFLSYTEISTCKYEVIIMTNRLCSHPAYRLKPKKNKHIHCYNVDEEAPAKPNAVVDMEKAHEINFKNEYVIKILSDVDPQVLKETVRDFLKEHELLPEIEHEIPMRLVGNPRQGWTLPSPFPNENILKETVDLLLTGQECISADQGWWIFEICYGKTIKQIHYEGPNRQIEHLLGRFDLEIHKAWVDQSPENRKPKEFDNKILQVSHLYALGDICHENKAHRSAEVRLRCKQGQQMLGTVTLTIEEPALCQYIITVESDRFCEPIQYADEYGIIRVEPIDVGPSVTTDPPPSDTTSTKEDLKP